MRNILCPGLLALAITLPAQAAESDVVARMGDNTLSLAEVRQAMNLTVADAEALDPEGLERLVRTEIIRKGVANEARRQAFDKKPEVAALIDRAAEQALVVAYMNSIAHPPANYPSADVLKQAYEANKAAFTTPVQFQVSQIYVSGTDAKAARLADGLYKQATRGKADFAGIARKSSQHKASADKGGDMGWLTEKDLVPAIRAALDSLKPGETAKPVAGGDGYHILRLTDRKASELLPLDKVKPLLIRNLRARRAKEIESAYLDALLDKTPVAVNGIALSELKRDTRK